MSRLNGPTESLLVEVAETLAEDQALRSQMFSLLCAPRQARTAKDRVNEKYESLITRVSKLIARLKEHA